jgi:hypothetical protein
MVKIFILLESVDKSNKKSKFIPTKEKLYSIEGIYFIKFPYI